MEPDMPRGVAYVIPSTASNKERIVEFLADNAAALLGTLRSYVQRMGVARGEEVTATAIEVLQEVVIEALDHADRFNPSGQPMAWLLGIAINIIKRKKVEYAKRSRRELFIHELSTDRQESLSDDELLDQIPACATAGPEQDVAANEQAALLLSLVSPEDQQLLQLAFLYGFEREALAEKLGITPAAARVRLHRALKRLRLAWREQHMNNQEGESHE
ncbi:MAG TPA: sigma-70 family RNA polymerase sigma factor [Ktedonobacteraceae bacterium]|jgi:RNA polymerase sigma-70 factor (ECF subfamily)|nr:sigma-70 family RNA polymerase sigma factor [Ktedonobacteraceae bacterium]